jgi:hypothetical protein
LRKATAPADIAMLDAYLSKKVASGAVDTLIKKAVRETLAAGK